MKISDKPVIVVKTGGRAASEKEAMKALFTEIASLQGSYSFILVHGGGAEVSRVSRIFGLEPVFRDGIRITTAREMEIVDMVLAGRMNKEIVRLANSCLLLSAGLSGSDALLFTGKQAGEKTLTGKITSVNPLVLKILAENNIMPVISSTSMTESGTALNINADEAALEIAAAVNAEKLFFISDIPGVLINNSVINTLTEKQSEEYILSGDITGGMIPKVRSSASALKKGIKAISIGEYIEKGDLKAVLDSRKGTSIISGGISNG